MNFRKCHTERKNFEFSGDPIYGYIRKQVKILGKKARNGYILFEVYSYFQFFCYIKNFSVRSTQSTDFQILC